MDTLACCYLLENNITKDQYIGVTTNFSKRSKQHKMGVIPKIKKDIEKYGWKSFSIKEIIRGTLDYCYLLEPKLIQVYNSTYNTALGGLGNSALPGENHHNAKLTTKQVLEIRNKAKTIKYKNLAILYNIGADQISRIVTGDSWGHIKEGILPKKISYGKRKLSNKQIIELRNLFSTGEYTMKLAAECYDMDRTSIRYIIDGKTYTNVAGPIRGINY